MGDNAPVGTARALLTSMAVAAAAALGCWPAGPEIVALSGTGGSSTGSDPSSGSTNSTNSTTSPSSTTATGTADGGSTSATTGATLAGCARALREAGASRVLAATVAATPPRRGAS